MTFDTDDRTPLSRDSFFGRALSTNRWGYRAVGSRERGEESSGRARSHVADGVSTPLLSVSTPRPMRETIILLEEIGRGGGGTVHKAMHVPSMRLVAVKMMEVHDDEKRRQMIKEIKALHSMNRVRGDSGRHAWKKAEAASSTLYKLHKNHIYIYIYIILFSSFPSRIYPFFDSMTGSCSPLDRSFLPMELALVYCRDFLCVRICRNSFPIISVRCLGVSPRFMLESSARKFVPSMKMAPSACCVRF